MSKVHKLALFGSPVKHSLSPQIHQEFASQFGLSIDYELIEVNDEELAKQVSLFFSQGGVGANVTLPHKKNIFEVVDKISERAMEAQAINTLYCDDDHLCGANTDGIGFVTDLSKRCQFDCQNKNILILGAGGATAGIIPSLLQQTPKKIIIANRSIEKAIKIAQHKKTKAISLNDLEKLNQSFDLVIHTSSLGHKGKTISFTRQHIKKNTVCYDLSYAKAAEPFITLANQLGITSIYDGIGMLVEQAACSFDIWFAKKPDTTQIIQNLLRK